MGVLGQGFLAGAGHDQRDLGEGRIGDVALGPVQHPAVAGLHRHSLHRRRIRAGARLGQAEAGDFTSGKTRQPFGLLLFRAAVLQCRADHADVDRGDRAIARHGIAQFPDRAGVLLDVHPCAAEFLGHGQAEQPHLAHLVHDVVGDQVGLENLLLGRDQPLADIALQLFDELFEDVGVHAWVCGAHGEILRSGRRGRRGPKPRPRGRSWA